jgi:hypothetical protein
MVFGRFQGDKKLDAQRAGLNQTLESLATLEQGIAGAEAYGEVWDAAGGIPADIPDRLAKARELGGLLAERMAMARRELPAFDDAAVYFRKLVGSIEQRWKAFLGLQMARRTILDGEVKAVAATLHPSVEQCQRAMIEIAWDFHGPLEKHIDELGPVRADFDGPWPEWLDLEKMRIGVDDVRRALEIYAERLGDGQGELPEASTVSLMEMIAMMQNSITLIEEQRVQLAMHLAMSAVMRNTGLR